MAVSKHKLTILQVSSFIANQNEKTVMRVVVGFIASAVGNTKFRNKQRLAPQYSPNESVAIRVKVGISSKWQ